MVLSKPLLHPPLTEVAFEISFPRQFIVENRIAEFQQALSTSYPVSSDEFSIRMPPAVAFGKPARPGATHFTPVRTFVFTNPLATRTVKVSPVNVTFVVTDYKDFSDYHAALLNILEPALRSFEIRRTDRIGLRYVNRIPIPREKGALAFQDYVHSPIDLRLFSQGLSGFLIEIHLGSAEEGRRLTMRGGLLPPDDDEVVNYLLDLDCYALGPVAIDEKSISTILTDYHDAIEAEFRRLITEKHWRYMESGEKS
jgi:uncharacterized protein (TIGR04255 family)